MFKNFTGDVIRDQSGKMWGIYRGVVENNNDPFQLHRVQVRIFGLHSPQISKNGYDGIPIEELPWADPICGLSEGGHSGYGGWTVPLNGTHVMIFFEDGNILQPKYFGVAPNAPRDPKYASSLEEAKKLAYQQATSRSIREAQDLYNNKDLYEPDKLPKGIDGMSKQMESNGDPKAYGWDGAGGASYGSAQMAAKQGMPQAFVKTLPPEYQQNFVGLDPNKPDDGFRAAWNKTVDQMGADKFKEYESQFIINTNWKPAVSAIPAFKMQDRCLGLQQIYYGMAVQYGPTGARKKLERAAQTLPNGKDSTDEELINALCTDRINNVETDFKTAISTGTKASSLTKRFETERGMGLGNCNNSLKDKDLDAIQDITKPDEESFMNNYTPTALSMGGDETGFKDPNGEYPRKDRPGELDSHKLTRGDTQETADQHVNEHRDGDINEIKTAGGTQWEEPKSTAKTEYPQSFVYATHGGHLIEIDNTVDAKRFRLFHPSNTFMEIDNDGNMVFKNAGNKFDIVLGSHFENIHGEQNETIQGSCWRRVYEDDTEQIDQTQKITIGKDYLRKVTNDDHGTIGNTYFRDIVSNARIYSKAKFELLGEVKLGAYAGGGGNAASTEWYASGMCETNAQVMVRIKAPIIMLN